MTFFKKAASEIFLPTDVGEDNETIAGIFPGKVIIVEHGVVRIDLYRIPENSPIKVELPPPDYTNPPAADK